MHSCAEVNSELEYVGISADTTEADLKQPLSQGNLLQLDFSILQDLQAI